MIQLENISKIYQTKEVRTNALQRITIAFPSRGLVAITGASGSGKTTLLNIVGGLDRYTEGKMVLHGQDSTDFTNKDWDQYRGNEIGFIFQQYNLISHLTVYENIEIPLLLAGVKKQERKKRIATTLHQLKMSEQSNKYPHALSSGQMQRIAIARALVKNPTIILADEPTGALDSKTAREVVQILKELAKNRLVLMVTHHDPLANEFADRVITMQDGLIIKDSNPLVEKESEQPKADKIKMSLFSALKWSFKNTLTKIMRSLLVMLGGSIGIMGVLLVLSISNGVNKYIIDIQKATLFDQPITIRSTVDNMDPNAVTEEYELYPDEDIIHVVREMQSYYGHVNRFQGHFLDYLEDLPSSYYNVIDYRTNLDMKILTRTEGIVRKVSTSRFYQLSENEAFLASQYEVLAGDFPAAKEDIVLLVDKRNAIDASVLYYLGIDQEDIATYTFSEMMDKEYKVIKNNEYYYKNVEDNYAYYSSGSYETLYNNATLTLKISGIIRTKQTATMNIYDNGILYSKQLSDYLIADANASAIGQDQLAHGLNKNVITGLPFEDSTSVTGTITKEYLYEAMLGDLGLVEEINMIRIYTDRFDNRVYINEYLQNYNTDFSDENKILYYDYMGNFAREFDAFAQVLTKVLIIFAAISLLVSSIMIGIITFVSVMERQKEIGILRSLGAKRIDIATVFHAQTAILGAGSGLAGLIFGVSFIRPIISLITKMMQASNITTFDLSTMQIIGYEWYYFVLLFLASTGLSVLSGSIPATIAAFKNPVDAIKSE
ncbi:MAG: ATP-binding cassette domain-containing protein [Bacilli bacterium]|nr:ATP-binding cassette domain-containing protein [Bacilli bacterium]